MAPKPRKSSKPLYNVSAYGAAGVGAVSISHAVEGSSSNPSTSNNVSCSAGSVTAGDENLILKLSLSSNRGGDDTNSWAELQAHEPIGLEYSSLAVGGEAPSSYEAYADYCANDDVCEKASCGGGRGSLLAATGNQSCCPKLAEEEKKKVSAEKPQPTTVVHLLKEFEEKSKNNEWPTSTQVHCYWCCHRFDNAPFGIPVRYAKGKFNVYGCFCSLECAASYNFSTHESLDEIWERHALINLLASKLGHMGAVKAAPDRLVLSMFGGHMTIEHFRGFCKTGRIVNINFPPMTTLTLQVEEVNECEINVNKFVPIDTDRVNKYKEKVMLRRTKPLLSNQKNTLDKTMNIRLG